MQNPFDDAFEFLEDFGEAGLFFLACLVRVLLIILTPVWIIPYWIIKQRGD